MMIAIMIITHYITTNCITILDNHKTFTTITATISSVSNMIKDIDIC